MAILAFNCLEETLSENTFLSKYLNFGEWGLASLSVYRGCAVACPYISNRVGFVETSNRMLNISQNTTIPFSSPNKIAIEHLLYYIFKYDILKLELNF